MKITDMRQRICIIGPSSSGKSTLATALSKKLDIPAYHLDQIAHIPHSNWKRRPDEEFVNEHDKLIAKEKWVIDGNYSVCMPQRFERAESVIWLDPSLTGTIWRYFIRSLRNKKGRSGKLEGAKHEFSFNLIKYTLFNYPKNKIKYKRMLGDYSHLKTMHITSIKELNDYYKIWELKRI